MKNIKFQMDKKFISKQYFIKENGKGLKTTSINLK